MAERAVAKGELVPLLPGFAHVVGGLYLVWPASRHPSAAATLLRDFIIEHIQFE
jgi:DNA-binding transcriptional LysR family regulator